MTESESKPKILTRREHNIDVNLIHPNAWKVLRRLHKMGHTAYLVGGTVRDLLLNRMPKDFDIGTTARPHEVKRIFGNAFMIGRRFRLVHIRFQENVIEVATFRRESDRMEEPEDGEGRPTAVRSYGSPSEDALRRDFTVNGLFYDPFGDNVIDYVGGLEDLKRRLVRTINPPDASYEEDPARMVRAVRVAARLGFTIEAQTREAVLRNREKVLRCPKARLMEEMGNLLKLGGSERSLRLLWTLGLMEFLIPSHHRYLSARQNAPLEPPRDDVLFDLFAMQDLLTSQPPPGLLYSLFTFPLILLAEKMEPHQFWQVKPGDIVRVAQNALAEFCDGVDIPKRHRARALEILVTQPKLVHAGRRGKPQKLAARPFFPESLEFMEVASRAIDMNAHNDIAYWKGVLGSLPKPAPAERPDAPHGGPQHPGGSRRRRRRRRGRGGRGPSTPGSEGQPHENT